jgi:cobalamin biosynthesis protein CobD/CbiB
MNIKKQSQPRPGGPGLSPWVLTMVLCPFSLFFVDSATSQSAKFLAIAAVVAVMFFAWCMAEKRMKRKIRAIEEDMRNDRDD